jgi:hypothetical protein
VFSKSESADFREGRGLGRPKSSAMKIEIKEEKIIETMEIEIKDEFVADPLAY